MESYLELIFPDDLDPADLEIIEAATYDQPGQARLLAAVVELVNGNGCRVYSSNGGALIGVITSEPIPPFNFSYLLGQDAAGEPLPAGPKFQGGTL